MIDSEHELRALLNDTPLANCTIATVAIAQSQEIALVIKVDDTAFDAWALLRSRVAQTGRWPVRTSVWADCFSDWADAVRDEDLFSRFDYDEEDRGSRQGDSPAAVIAASAGLDVAQAVAALGREEREVDADAVEYAIAETLECFGAAPSIGAAKAFLREHRLTSYEELERWLFDWEIATFPSSALQLPPRGLSHLTLRESDSGTRALVLLPSARGWEVPAYMRWYGSTLCNSQIVVALFKEWNEKYGAELVTYEGTRLAMRTARRPATPQEALHLAWQQYLIAPSTLIPPCVSLRDHARALLHTHQWFLHQRP